MNTRIVSQIKLFETDNLQEVEQGINDFLRSLGPDAKPEIDITANSKSGYKAIVGYFIEVPA